MNVTLVTNAFDATLEFCRTVTYHVGNLDRKRYGAATWLTGVTGTLARDPEYVVKAVDQGVDKFLNEYVKANGR